MFYVLFGFIAVVLLLGFYALLYPLSKTLHPYLVWMIGTNLVTLFFYWIDKRLSKVDRFTIRVPELVLNGLVVLGGFLGAWIGRLRFDHKTNIGKHVLLYVILLLSTLLHGWLICRCLSGEL